MKIAIVGPTHPYKGGIAQHTTELAHHLQRAGDEVVVISWRAQYPFFYPGAQFVPENKPELPVFEDTRRVLSWKSPLGWIRWGRRLRNYDLVIFVWFVPTIQGPIYRTMLRSIGQGPRTLLLCHNVIRHGAGSIDRQIAKHVFAAVDGLLVHTESQAMEARQLTKTAVTIATMPAHLPGRPNAKDHPTKLRHRLLFFGLVRKYKGVDILLRAIALQPGIKLTVAGEMWGKQREQLTNLIKELSLQSRVELRPGYVSADTIGALFKAADALVMPYRSGTASQTAELAFAYGVPVIATRVGSMPQQIRDGVDGFLCEPNDPADLAAAISRLYAPDTYARLRKQLPKSHADADWQHYVTAITGSK